jgi:uncharacterized BrkB/YihY/UPF0761 family membrane protein
MFKSLPDTYVAWRDVWPGAAVTAALFEIGKLLIGLYIGKQALESNYGAAASLVVLLIWVYYSSQLVLMGAEFTRVYTTRRVPGNMSASDDRPTDAGVDHHYVHAAVERSPYAPLWRRCWSCGFWPASSFAINARQGRRQHAA